MRSLSLSCCFVKSRAEIDSVVEALLPLTNNDITKILATVEKFPSGLHTSKGNRFAVSKIDLHRLLHHVQTIFRQEETLITLPPKKYIIVGDIHGQIYDLLHIFRTYGRPPHLNYIFLGDYVDRGPHSLEVLTFLLCFKALYPQNIYLIRGNHETEEVSKIFGFRLECEARISPCTWSACVNIFNTLPLAIVIEEPVSVFCVHGGISPHIPDLDTIRNSCHRPCNITDSSPSLLVDLLWADPCNTLDMWSSNRRGRSYEFGIEAASRFLKRNGLKRIVRGHTAQSTGYEEIGENSEIVTIFSSSNYKGMENPAAVMIMEMDGTYKIDLLARSLLVADIMTMTMKMCLRKMKMS